MTANLQIAAVCNAIEALTISGLTIKDIDSIPAQGDRRGAYLIPMNNNPTDMSFSIESFWENGLRFYIVEYTLVYRLLYAPLGEGRTKTLESVSGNIAMIVLILNKLLDTKLSITGVEEMKPLSVSAGPVNDPSEKPWWGADIMIRVTEYVNA